MVDAAMPAVVRKWHEIVELRDARLLDALLADDAVFYSPAVHAPQVGRPLTTAYLSAAMIVLGPTLRYVHEWYDESSAVLRFEAEVSGRAVHGVDIFAWNDADQIVEFTVMVRPFRALEAVIAAMGAQLATLG